ncbi:hypothetical protein FOL46_007769 [Perkinsus olseni]|uniref:CUE domain-containing protein n=1 Tax=Perkinsus olseni TaxID=32597 RepID=A0A7J6LBI9_PEROL|nr:hypothetical protein FOL46_007769 [Perkinsus olseni]
MMLSRKFRRSKKAADAPPPTSNSAPLTEPTPGAEYVQVVASPLAEAFKTLQEMFPEMKVEMIDEVLLNNNAELEPCIDECLARQAQDDELPSSAGPAGPSEQTTTAGRYPQTPQAPRAAPFIRSPHESSPSPTSSSASWSSLLQEMLGEGSTPADHSGRKQPSAPETLNESYPAGGHLVSYDSVASGFAAVDEDSDFGKHSEAKKKYVEGNDAWDDWFGSKVDVPGHSDGAIVPPSDPSKVYSMSRHDSLADEGGPKGRLFLEKPEGFDTIGDTLKEVCSSIERLCEQQDEVQIRVLDLSNLDLTDAELSAILEALLEASVLPEDEVRVPSLGAGFPLHTNTPFYCHSYRTIDSPRGVWRICWSTCSP